MRDELDVTRVVRSWLDEGANRLPERVLDAVLDAVPTIPQRRPAWSAWRLFDMPKLLQLATVAVVVLVAGFAVMNLLPRAGDVGAPGPSPTPSPSSTPTPLAISSIDRPLSPGAYRVGDPFDAPFTVSFATDWTPRSLSRGDVEFVRSAPATGAAWVVVNLVDGVYPDPCHAEGGPGPARYVSRVDSMVAELTHLAGFEAGPVTDVEVGGRPAKAFRLSNTIDTETAGCTGGPMLWLWDYVGGTTPAGTNGGATENIWVVDVNGTPVVIDGETFPTTPGAQIGDIQSVVESIRFE